MREERITKMQQVEVWNHSIIKYNSYVYFFFTKVNKIKLQIAKHEEKRGLNGEREVLSFNAHVREKVSVSVCVKDREREIKIRNKNISTYNFYMYTGNLRPQILTSQGPLGQ